MRLLYFFSLLIYVVLTIISSNFKLSNNYELDCLDVPNLSLDFNVSDINKYEYHNDLYDVYGNFNDITKKCVKELINNENKIIIFYDVNLNDNIDANLEVLKNHIVIYYHLDGIPNINTFKSQTTDDVSLKNEIKEYIVEVISKINDEKEKVKLNNNPNEDLFSGLYSGSFREQCKPYGYIDCNYDVLKYMANDISSLYLIKTKLAYTPGSIACNLFKSGYENKWENYSGYVKVKANLATNNTSFVFKDAYLASVNSDFCFINHCKDPDDVEKYDYLYTYEEPKIETNHLEVGYLFEMNNKKDNLLEGDLAFNYEYKMTVRDKWLGIFHTDKSFEGSMFHNYY